MGAVQRVRNVSAAVELASALQLEGKHDWFRGQLENWPLRSTFSRLTPVEKQDALHKLGRFEKWAKETLGLEAIAADADALLAIAQHYGLPTNFVDFTTRPAVAGFFASDNPRNRKVNKDSCIICLSTADLKDCWNGMPAQYPPPELLCLDVPNLWRLEAQKGCFLFCQYPDFEQMYDLDRILFPYTGLVAEPTREQIYPKQKSQLEVLLDGYFMNEVMIQGDRDTHAMFPGLHEIHLERPDTDPDVILGGELPVVDSWGTEDLVKWIKVKGEPWREVSAVVSVTLPLTRGAAWRSRRDLVEETMASELKSHPDIRRHSIRWSLETDSPIEEAARQRLIAGLSRLWDGVRSLPYSDAQITYAVGQCVALWSLWVNMREHVDSGEAWGRAASACYQEPIEVQFGRRFGEYSRGYAQSSSLLAAVRKDIDRHLNPEYAAQVSGRIGELTWAVTIPSRLFEFEPFADVFVRQIVPSQVLVRLWRADLAMFFSPARLEAFSVESLQV